MNDYRHPRPVPSIPGYVTAQFGLFPLLELTKEERLPILKDVSIPAEESIVGIANLPMVFIHRLRFFERDGVAHWPKNQPLHFSLQPEVKDPWDYWEELMTEIKALGYPHVWSLLPQRICEAIIVHFVKDSYLQKVSYYHNPPLQFEENYFLVSKKNDQVLLRPAQIKGNLRVN